jgi:integrase
MSKEKIKNPNYNKFLKEGMIDLIGNEEIKAALSNVKGRNKTEGRALLICAYATGARPVEYLQLKGKDIRREKHEIYIKLPAAKNGLPRDIPISIRRMPFITELHKYAMSCMPEMFIFWHFRTNGYRRLYKCKNGKIKEYIEYTDSLRYHFNKWFEGVIKGSIPPYFLRHNRFSRMMSKGATTEQVRLWKGSKTLASVSPYAHLSKEMAKKASKFVD